MRYLLVFLLAVSPLLAADVKVRSATVKEPEVNRCITLFHAYDDLGDDPSGAAQSDALANADENSYIIFSTAFYDDACVDLFVCTSKSTQACNILGGAIDKVRTVDKEGLSACGARCIVPPVIVDGEMTQDERKFIISFKCAS